MRPGPAKQFDPQAALERARDLFWRRGYDGTGLTELEAALGVGRKSLYDTFGNKRALYLAALEQYGASVIEGICAGLERADTPAFDNLERVLNKLARHHGSGESLGCLLGVALGVLCGAQLWAWALVTGRVVTDVSDSVSARMQDSIASKAPWYRRRTEPSDQPPASDPDGR